MDGSIWEGLKTLFGMVKNNTQEGGSILQMTGIIRLKFFRPKNK